MELFTINRYDTNEFTKKDDPDRERKILENLQKNIDKKKKKLKKDKKQEEQRRIEKEEAREEVQELQQQDVAAEAEAVEQMEVDTPEDVPEAKELEPKTMDSDFLVLGDDRFQKKQHIDAMLPPWLACPTVISNDLSDSGKSIENLAYLDSSLKDILKSMSIEKLFPVQEAVIPWVLDVHSKPMPFRPRDICVSAPTGSGKTLAYAVPIVQLLLNSVDRRVRALIVLPVNELAVQVVKVFKRLCEQTHLTCALLSKFVPFETEQSQLVEQFNGKYYSKVDIVVATTGRLVEHIHSTKGFSLKSLKYLVMDEADRIMEQIHNNWLYHLDSHVKQESDTFFSGRSIPLCYMDLCNDAMQQPHKLLFSATLSQDPEKLQNLRLFQPKLFTAIVRSFEPAAAASAAEDVHNIRGDFIGKFTTPAELTEKYCLTQPELKPLTLCTLIKENNWKRFLCFTNSGEAAHRLSFVLQKLFKNEMKIEELSSGLQPNVRNAVLLKFKTDSINGLVCSDALARGIDIAGVDIVISYDAPRHIKTYIHRIGRTARAGRQGLAVTLLADHELRAFHKLLKGGGKGELNEIKIISNTEELLAKEYSSIVENLQIALKREEQIKVIKSLNEKQKTKKKKGGLVEELQSRLHTLDPSKIVSANDDNVPESWKWQHQYKINVRKERKNKSKRKSGKKTVAAAAAIDNDETK